MGHAHFQRPRRFGDRKAGRPQAFRNALGEISCLLTEWRRLPTVASGDGLHGQWKRTTGKGTNGSKGPTRREAIRRGSLGSSRGP